MATPPPLVDSSEESKFRYFLWLLSKRTDEKDSSPYRTLTARWADVRRESVRQLAACLAYEGRAFDDTGIDEYTTGNMARALAQVYTSWMVLFYRDETPDVAIDAVQYPTPVAETICEKLLPEWRGLFLRKNAGYGASHALLGARGCFPDLYRKVFKMKTALWDGEELTGEQPREILFDMIGHAFMIVAVLEEEEQRASS